MNLFKIYIFSSLLLGAAVLASGNEPAHGGGGLGCLLQNGHLSNFTALDLAEFTKYHLTEDRSLVGNPFLVNASVVLKRIEHKISEMNPAVLEKLEKDLYRVKHRLIPSMTSSIPRIFDATIEVVDQSRICPNGKIFFFQVFSYQDSEDLFTEDTIKLNNFIYSAMTPDNQVALLLHEVIYHWYRFVDRDQTSDRAREAVTYLFSTTHPLDYPDEFKTLIAHPEKLP